MTALAWFRNMVLSPKTSETPQNMVSGVPGPIGPGTPTTHDITRWSVGATVDDEPAPGIVLDDELLPSVPCLTCGHRHFWTASEPELGCWRCQACDPPEGRDVVAACGLPPEGWTLPEGWRPITPAEVVHQLEALWREYRPHGLVDLYPDPEAFIGPDRRRLT